MYIAASDALYYSNQAACYFICKINLPQLLDYTLLWKYPSAEAKYEALFVLFNAMQMI